MQSALSLAFFLFSFGFGTSLPDAPVPDAPAFRGWNVSQDDLHQFKPVEIACADKTLLPTHPQMTMKTYHKVLAGSYNHFLLQADSKACTIGGRTKNAKGEFPCFQGNQLKYYLLSDTYQDRCGNFYRGYFEALFFRTQETMASLYSPGRSVIAVQRPGGLPPDFDPSSTQAVSVENLFQLEALLENEKDKVMAEQMMAQKLGFLRTPDGLFHKR